MISIIVPIYNVEQYLPQCLDSLIHQTYQDVEIICVNDGSTDGSLRILEEYARQDSRIRLISRENRGISASRNEALEAVRGEWVMFVDSDDWMDQSTCEVAVETGIKLQVEVVMWAYCREYASQSLPKYYISQQRIWEEKEIRNLHRRIVGPVKEELSRPDTLDAWGTIWGKLYCRSLIENPTPIRFVDTKKIGSAEDVLFNVEYMGRIRKAVYLPMALYHYRKEGTSFTTHYKADLPQKWNELYTEIQRSLQRQGLESQFQEAYHNRISLGIIGLGLNITFSDFSFQTKCHALSLILDSPTYKQAISRLPLKNLPAHWQLFFTLAKHQMSFGLLILLSCIKKIISK